MYYKNEDISGKQRIKGAEAPSARVYKSSTEEMIIGMMAVNVQMLISLYSLDEQNCIDIIKRFENEFKFERRLNLCVIVKNSFEEIEKFKLDNSIERVEILQDTKGDFGKKFGVLLEGSQYTDNIANGLFVIDKEAELKCVEYFESLDDNKMDEIISLTNDVINFKQKGHTHENWMG